jgi:outer membrane protein assembly factor BamE (lipoprotein component of BamABCDE complex)
MIDLKIVVATFCLSITTSSCAFIKYQITPEFTKEQCSIVRKNFNKLKLGMNKDKVIPLIGGERTRKIYRRP